jgi:hypothetical protein
MKCPCCGLLGPHKSMIDGCIPALRTRICGLESTVNVYERVLEEIANNDYRGNRSSESNLAYNALHPKF